MQPKLHILSACCLAALLLVTGSCSKQLTEQPKTVFGVNYFQSAAGLQSAINTLYSDLRYEYGPEGTNGLTCDGTDEWTYADQVRTGAGGTGDYLTLGNYTLDASNGAIETPWNYCFSAINLANGVVQWAPGVSMDSTSRNQIVAQARFLRGLNYLLLVEQFGAVPVDLGSGSLQFNQSAYQGFNRLPIDTVFADDYAAMIGDFTYASQNLAATRPAGAFILSQASAYLMLARVYIFRAYSKYAQSTDFASAYTAAMQVINNQAQYGVALQQDFAQVNSQYNNYNSEILYSVERLPGDLNVNEATSGQIGGGKEVDATNDFNPAYTLITAPLATSTAEPCGTRTTLYGRPLRRFCPTAWLFDSAFADKVNDARYNGSFRTVWLATQAVGGYAVGDTAIFLANTDLQADSLAAIKPYRVIKPSEMYVIGGTYNEDIYPSLSKFQDSLKNAPNDPGGRPYPVAKLSELYLLAAEAALQGNVGGGATQAANLINVIRQRAAYRPGLSTAQLTAYQNNMTITAGQVTLDFIMDERTRELCGESIRWPDLAMRGLLVSRVQAHNPDAAANIQSFMTLRPIPQAQLNAVDVQNPAYQNPGY